MASSNIKLFDENKGNMLSDSEFSISNQRLNGLQTGVASSQLQNKAMYQVSLVAYAIAQLMLQNGKNANDTDAVSAFVANLSGTMLQKVYDLATTEEAQAGVATGKWMSPALVKVAIDTLAAKAQNILSDNTKLLFGLSSDAVPDDLFKMIMFPKIIATARTGSTITCKKGDIVLTAEEVNKTWTFLIPEYGEWIVSNGETYNNILVDTVKIYTTEVIHPVNYKMIVDVGDECADFTGGLTGSYTKNDDSLSIGSIKTVNNIDPNSVTLIGMVARLDSGDQEYSRIGASVGGQGLTIMKGSYGTVDANTKYNVGLNNKVYWAFSFKENNITPTEIKPADAGCSYSTATLYSLFFCYQDDINTLCSIAGVGSYESNSALLANSLAISTILSNQEAVSFMKEKCTGDFMAAAVQSSTFLSALNDSPYKELVYANEDWAKFLAMVA